MWARPQVQGKLVKSKEDGSPEDYRVGEPVLAITRALFDSPGGYPFFLLCSFILY